MMDIEVIKTKVLTNQYTYSHHAEIERTAENLTLVQVEESLLNGEIIEQYSDTGRGESSLVMGFSSEMPIHTVCGWRGDKIVIITVYVPRLPKFVNPWTRGR